MRAVPIGFVKQDNVKRPLSLKSNDKAIIISPAGSIERHLVEDAAAVLEKWGLVVEISEHALDELGRFSGAEVNRLFDLQKAFDDRRARCNLYAPEGGMGQFISFLRLTLPGYGAIPEVGGGFQ